VRRKLPAFHAIPPGDRKAFHESVLEEILQEGVASLRDRRNPRGVNRKMSNFPLRPRLRIHYRQSTSKRPSELLSDEYCS